jgi:hypothetical protein
MTSNQKRGTIAYKKAADMKQSLTNYGGENYYMSPPISPRSTLRTTIGTNYTSGKKFKTATKVRGNGAKEQAERLRLGYSGAMTTPFTDNRDRVLGFVSPDMRDTIHSPIVN